MSERIMVITPTTGKDTVHKAMQSVENQTVYTEHLIVADGVDAILAMNKMPYGHVPKCVSFVDLPENVGGNGWYGHRVYAAMPLMVNADYILFLDEDNWFEPNHVETLLQKIKSKDLMWAHSLRRIINERDEYVFDDDIGNVVGVGDIDVGEMLVLMLVLMNVVGAGCGIVFFGRKAVAFGFSWCGIVCV
jgi:GT2 family glycosyltransferase